MVKTLMKYIGGYWKSSVLSMLCMLGEVVAEILIPLAMANLIDLGISQGNLPLVFRYGTMMAVCALFGLLFGFGGGRFGRQVRGEGFQRIRLEPEERHV